MDNYSYSPTATPAWKNLESLANQIISPDNTVTIQSLFDKDKTRAEKYTLQVGELLLDFSKNLVTDDVWQQLLQLAEQSPLTSHRASMFAGEAINRTENRAVLHSALRAHAQDANTGGQTAR